MPALTLIIKIYPDTLHPADLQRLIAAVDVVVELTQSGAVEISRDQLSTKHARVGMDDLQTQTQIILDCIRQYYANESFTVAQLAAHLSITHATIRTQLHTLRGKNLVRRQPQPDGQRRTRWLLIPRSAPLINPLEALRTAP